LFLPAKKRRDGKRPGAKGGPEKVTWKKRVTKKKNAAEGNEISWNHQ